MKKYLNSKKTSGFTIIEILVGVVILGIATYIWIGGLNSMFPILHKGKDRFDLSIEQRAVVSLLESVSETAIRGALCYDPSVPIPDGYPHPYGKLSYDGTCETIRVWTPAEKAAWEDLADKIMAWQGNSPGTSLDATYYTSTILPAMSTAGCLKCHSGGAPKTYDVTVPPTFTSAIDNIFMNNNRPDLSNRDFNNLSHITADPFTVAGIDYKPLATRAVLSSPLAQMFFKTKFEISKVIPGSTYLIKHHISFKVETTSISIPSFNSISKIGNFCIATSGSTANCGPAPAGACNTAIGEAYDGSSCRCNCTVWNPPPVCSCGKGCVMICPGAVPSCASWETTYSCLSPSKVKSIVINGEDGHSPTTANFTTPQLEVVADNYCANGLIAGQQCGGNICGASPPSTACLEQGSCKRMCTDRSWSNPVVCGKGCVIPPQPTDCLKQKVQFNCHYPLPQGVTQSAILSYTLNSELIDGGVPIAQLVTSGVIK